MKTKRVSKHFDDEIDSEGSWAISYGDMITLLVTFFVLFFSIDKNEVAQDKLLSDFITKLKSVDDDPLKEKIVDKKVEKLHLAPKDEVLSKWGGVIRKENGKVYIDFPHISFFDLGQTKVNEIGKKILKEFVSVFTPYAGIYSLGVQANTDSRKVKYIPGRKYEDNLELSALRAVSAMRVIQRYGIPLNRMKLIGLGELQNNTAARELSSVKYSDPEATARKVTFVIEPNSQHTESDEFKHN